MKKWYVFDEADCFDSYDTAAAAGARADELVAEEFEGVHILHLTEEQFDAYCMTGKLPC